MDKFKHPLVRGASYLLIYSTAVTPLHPAYSAGITATNGNTQVHMKPGDVPVVNIATPNGAGISHNTYKDFNVAAPGAVLNNATQGGKTQLGVDIINGNPNLKGKPADLIINEVTGGSRSELQGKLEVFGNKANVMIANPNGITCDGCGFINAPGVTLTTGKPQFDKQGALDALEVKKGSVAIGGKGLDGGGQDYVDIISRATELNGKINARNLSLTQGANRVSFADGSVKAIVGEGVKPQLAVDTKALGGMYANKIRLVANEDGVGVNLKDLDSNQRDVMLSVNGKITLSGKNHSKTDFNVSARELQVASGATVQADGSMTLAATTLNNNGQLTTSGDMRIFGDHIRNVGDNTKLHANKNMWIQKDAQGNKASDVENRSATIKTNTGDLVIRTDRLDNTISKADTVIRTEHPTEARVADDRLGWTMIVPGIAILEAGEMDPGDPTRWFGAVDYNHLTALNTEKQHYTVQTQGARPVIRAGKDLYLNAGSLTNRLGDISAARDAILTGRTFSSQNLYEGTKKTFYLYENNPDVSVFIPYNKGKPDEWDYHIRKEIRFRHSGETTDWTSGRLLVSRLNAGGNLVADFSERIESNEPYATTDQHSDVIPRPDTITAKNIVLHAGQIITTDVMKATGDIILQAEKGIKVALGLLTAEKDISILAGGDIESWQSELKGQDITLVSHTGNVKSHTSEQPNYYHADGVRWLGSLQASRDLTLTAGGTITLLNTLLAPQSRNISMTAPGSISIMKNDAILARNRPGENLSADKRLAYFNNLLQAGGMNASGTITLNSGGYLALRGANIRAGKDITLLAGHNADLNYRALDGNYGHPFSSSRTPELGSQVHAGGNLLINSARDIGTQGGTLSANGNVNLLAGQNLWLSNVAYSAIDAANDNNKDDRHVVTTLSAGKDLTAAANNQLLTYGARLTSGGNMTLTSGGDMRFEAVQNHTYREGGNEFTETRTQQGTELNAGGLMTVISNGSILFQATKLMVKGLDASWKLPAAVTDWGSRIAVAEQQLQNAQQRINQAQQEKTNAEHVVTQRVSSVQQAEAAVRDAEERRDEFMRNNPPHEYGSGWSAEVESWDKFVTQREAELGAARNNLAAARNDVAQAEQRINQGNNTKNEAQNSLIAARQEAQSKGADEAKQKAQVDAHNQAEAMRAGNMDIAAKGGYLYAQAMEESSHYEKKETKRKWWGKKKEIKQTRHDVTNKVTEFTAAGNISLLSRDDSTYEASKIAAGQNARLTSTHGQVNFRAVKDTSFEQTVSNSKGFFIKQVNKGYEDNKWVLPGIHVGGALTVDAANGVSADVKVKNGQSLQNAITVLGNTPGTIWLKSINTRNDVQWNTVKDAYDSWDYKSQHLNPAVAAVIAIAAAAATAGAGLATMAGTTAVSATGATGTAASAVYGAGYAGMTSLVSQSAVALVDNRGNLSKTLQALGSSETVRATATAMAIGGALAGFDKVMNVDVPADKAPLPALIKDEDWSKIAQRVAGQSVISSSLNTTINGGSFKDNLTNALLANIGNQINAEGAGLIGDNGQVLGSPGRAVSHAVVAGISAEIGRGNGSGAAAGALAAELAGVILGDNIIKPEEWQKKSEQQAQMARILGSVAGAAFTGKASGAYSGATGGETAFRYNYLSHKQQELMEKDLAAAKSPLDKALVLANWGITSHTQDGAFAAGVVSGIPVEINDTVDGLVAVASNPREAADALIALIKNDDRFSIIGGSVKQEYLGRVEAFKTKYEHAGIDGAYGAGLEFGKLTMAGLGLFAGAAGAGKLGVKITTNSIKALEKTTVKDLTTLGLTREQQTIIKNAEGISTAKAHQATAPRDLNEQVLWNLVKQNPEKGMELKLNKDPKFSTTAGFQKMQAAHKLPDGNNIVIHYQYNKYTGKAYDMKFDSPKRNDLQPGPSIKGDKNS